MTCANTGITILSLINIVLVMWPNMLGLNASLWIVALSSLLVIIFVWTGCSCKWCAMKPAMKTMPARKVSRKKRK